MYYPPEQLKPLFEVYDADGSGLLDYKEFTAVVFGGYEQAQLRKGGQDAKT